MWAVDMSRHAVDMPSEGWETSVALVAKAIPPRPPTPSTLCWWFLDTSDTHCGTSFLKCIEATLPSTLEPSSKSCPCTSSFATRGLLRNTEPHFVPAGSEPSFQWDRRWFLHTEVWEALIQRTLTSDPVGTSYHIFLLLYYFLFCICHLRANIVLLFQTSVSCRRNS